ncbi:uncharacterized protein LOC129761457 [Toxorhynchites rutilus septentrionalis]|uniref:uncharacterized protein LOC129761457 n=1 Tax=Toxorhynchites rutilus septentrionalis TaxID=329112 RepID=UPI0024798E98|nr:uncharacterized protein LOC129761457 [Toxorhynchites rutilus septentrionalis]
MSRENEKRTYTDYTPEKLQAAVAEVQKKGASIYVASWSFGIPYSTLYHKVHGLHNKKPGSPNVITDAQEKDLADTVRVEGIWGFPLTADCIKKLVKQFLDHNKMNTKLNNSPGKDWVNSFLKRHNLVSRLSQNIKRSRAKVDPRTINEYFDNLATTVDDVPSENMINYDETYFSDDPGSTKVVVQRGQKHVDRVMDHSKSSFSVMFTGAGNGKVLPPYVVYAALHLYPTWTEGGPKGCRYNRTKSGWFDSAVFEDWFFTVALPYFKGLRNDKKSIIIGDNVASHLSFRVLQSCIANNISFVLLPPNSTHLCQPLDVVYFGKSMERYIERLEEKEQRMCS